MVDLSGLDTPFMAEEILRAINLTTGQGSRPGWLHRALLQNMLDNHQVRHSGGTQLDSQPALCRPQPAKQGTHHPHTKKGQCGRHPRLSANQPYTRHSENCYKIARAKTGTTNE